MSVAPLLIAGVSIILIFVSGFWVSRTGKPYSTGILTIHKLISLAVLIYLGMQVQRFRQTAIMSPLQWLSIALAGILFIVTILTGGFLSMEKDMPAVLKTVHHILPYATAATALVALFLLA